MPGSLKTARSPRLTWRKSSGNRVLLRRITSGPKASFHRHRGVKDRVPRTPSGAFEHGRSIHPRAPESMHTGTIFGFVKEQPTLHGTEPCIFEAKNFPPPSLSTDYQVLQIWCRHSRMLDL